MNKLFAILFCLFFTLSILLISYQLILATTTTTTPQQQTLDWLATNNTLPLNYTTSEFHHLQDVQKVMNKVDFITIISILASLTLGFYFYQHKRLTLNLWYASLTSSFILLSITILLFTSFDPIFTLFHKIFFSQGNWQFSADSLIIQTFPIEFFIRIGIKTFGIALGCCIVLGIKIYYHRRKYTKPNPGLY